MRNTLGRGKGLPVGRTSTALILGVVVAALLIGCAGSAAQQTAAPTSAPTDSESPNTYLMARRIYGDRLQRVIQSPPFEGDSQVALYIGGGEPVGTEPFRMLDVLRRENPGGDSYVVAYTIRPPASESSGLVVLSSYHWNPAKGTVQHYAGTGAITDSNSSADLVGTASGITDARLSAIAEATTQPIPEFK